MKKHHVFKANGIFIGIVFIVLAVCLILCNVGILGGSAYLIFMTVLMAAIFVRSIISLSFTPSILALGHLAHLYRDTLAIPDSLPSWLLILASAILGIGLDIVFKSVKKSIRQKNGMDFDAECHNNFNSNNGSNNYISGNMIHIENGFGEQTRYIKSEEFSNGSIENGFGQLTVYFDNVTLANNNANLHVENGFGCVNIYMPSSWRINLTEENGMGQITTNGTPSTDPNAPIINAHVENGMGKVNLFFT